MASPLEKFGYNLSENNSRLLRATNNEPRPFSRIQMRRCRDILMIELRPCAVRHKFRLCLGFTAGRPPLLSVLAAALHLPIVGTWRTRKALGVPYGIAYRRWEKKRSQIAKKYMASGFVRRGCPDEGSPLRNFAAAYSVIMVCL